MFVTESPSWNDENGNGVPDDMDLETETDLDGNGVSDAHQEGFKVLATFDGMNFLGVKAMDNVLDIECLQSVSPRDIPNVNGRPHDLPTGLVGMRLLTEKPGDAVRVEMHFPEPVPENGRVFAYDALNGWQDLSGKAAVSSDGKRIMLTLEDGGKGDADGCKNGVIVRTLGIGTAR
jgi:hypothetical protein